MDWVSPAKSGAMWFYNYRRRGTTPPGLCLDISGKEVEVGLQIKYFDLTINSQWTLEPHFKLLVPKVTTAANASCDLLPNIGRAEVGVRRLYEGVVHSRILYGAPLWAGDLMTSRRSLLLLRRLQRTIAIRIVRGCRTISYASATVLAASPPFELQALVLRRVHRRPETFGGKLDERCLGGCAPIHSLKTRSMATGPLDRPCQIGRLGGTAEGYRCPSG